MARTDAAPTPPPAPQYRRWDAAWKPGDPRPMIDTSSPAVAQAVGRCLTSRIKVSKDLLPRLLPSKSFHPKPCNWEEYRTEDLRAALGYACWASKLDLVSGEYANEEWARFFAGVTPATQDLPPDVWQKAAARRHAAIEEAMYGGLQETLAGGAA